MSQHRERAEALVKQWQPDSCASMANGIERAIDAAVAAERERCAKLCEEEAHWSARQCDNQKRHGKDGLAFTARIAAVKGVAAAIRAGNETLAAASAREEGT